MEIYTINTDFLLDKNTFNKFLPFVSDYRKSKVEKLRFEKDKVLSLGAGLLLSFSLAKAGIDEKTLVFTKGEHGKPYLNGSGLYFSLSHSGHRAALILDTEECGIDIELVSAYKPQVATRFFSEMEKTLLGSYDGDEALQNECFTRIWTRKESYGKFTGYGLNFTDDFQKSVMDETEMSARGIFFNEYRIIDKQNECSYIISACSVKKEIANICLTDINNMEEIDCVIHRN